MSNCFTPLARWTLEITKKAGDSMDFIPDTEFHIVFERVSASIDLKGAGTPREINDRLHRRIETYKELCRRKRISRGESRRRIKSLKLLISAGFGRRTISEAMARPNGKVSLTLKYGKSKADEILLARARRRIGSLRIVVRKRTRR